MLVKRRRVRTEKRGRREKGDELVWRQEEEEKEEVYFIDREG